MFNMPYGQREYHKLPFGISSAPETFYCEMENTMVMDWENTKYTTT